jgi:hypothetical protein
MKDLILLADEATISGARGPQRRIIITILEPDEDDILEWLRTSVDIDKIKRVLGLETE